MICIRSLLFRVSRFFFHSFRSVCLLRETVTLSAGFLFVYTVHWLQSQVVVGLPRASSFVLKFPWSPGLWTRDLSLSMSGVNIMPSTRLHLFLVVWRMSYKYREPRLISPRLYLRRRNQENQGESEIWYSIGQLVTANHRRRRVGPQPLATVLATPGVREAPFALKSVISTEPRGHILVPRR